ncbi:MAG: arsenosugar biosynthesis radical SAM (seleno)protein ArsS [Clostridiaceae bacterium]
MSIQLNQIEDFNNTLIKYKVNSNRSSINTLQLNIGKKCNQACTHCHVDAGPSRTEEMTKETIDRIIYLLKSSTSISTVDITGGAPELNKNFRYLIIKLRELNLNIIDRCNLSVLFEKGQENTASFLAENNVTIIASLPCYLEDNVDLQRGGNTYKKSISALKQLNELGYGQEQSGLILNLVYNPLGSYLPSNQQQLESDYKKFLKTQYGIVFNNLYTITNMPIKRFADSLIRDDKYDDYYDLLFNSFNPEAAKNVMCKNQLSISWDGEIFDCDFNQALNVPLSSGKKSIWDINNFNEACKSISFRKHCYGCTAGNGSSCKGKLV